MGHQTTIDRENNQNTTHNMQRVKLFDKKTTWGKRAMEEL